MKKFAFLLMAVLFATLPMAAAEKVGVATFKETSHDFGYVKEDKGPVTHYFEFKNTGDGPLLIISAVAMCGCTRPDYPKNPLKPGESGKIKVTYNPKGRPGSFNKTVTVRTNGKAVHLKIKGTVVPEK